MTRLDGSEQGSNPEPCPFATSASRQCSKVNLYVGGMTSQSQLLTKATFESLKGWLLSGVMDRPICSGGCGKRHCCAVQMGGLKVGETSGPLERSSWRDRRCSLQQGAPPPPPKQQRSPWLPLDARPGSGAGDGTAVSEGQADIGACNSVEDASQRGVKHVRRARFVWRAGRRVPAGYIGAVVSVCACNCRLHSCWVFAGCPFGNLVAATPKGRGERAP